MSSEAFVEYIFRVCSSDKGLRADLKRADNDSFEWKVWPIILKFNSTLDNDDVRRAYALIGSSIAKSGRDADGSAGIGKAFRVISNDPSDEFSPRFMRLLSSDSVSDLIDYLRPALSFIEAKGVQLDYSRLLDDILRFRFEDNRIRVKAAWASDYLLLSEKTEES